MMTGAGELNERNCADAISEPAHLQILQSEHFAKLVSKDSLPPLCLTLAAPHFVGSIG